MDGGSIAFDRSSTHDGLIDQSAAAATVNCSSHLGPSARVDSIEAGRQPTRPPAPSPNRIGSGLDRWVRWAGRCGTPSASLPPTPLWVPLVQHPGRAAGSSSTAQHHHHHDEGRLDTADPGPFEATAAAAPPAPNTKARAGTDWPGVDGGRWGRRRPRGRPKQMRCGGGRGEGKGNNNL